MMQFSIANKDDQTFFKLCLTTNLPEVGKIVHITKIDQDIYALFDIKGKLSFISPDDEGTTQSLPLKNLIES